MKNVKIGSVIKSFDFYGNTDCYMIGEVLEIKGNVLVCKTLKQVFNNMEEVGSDTFSTPMQGEGLMDDSSLGLRFYRFRVFLVFHQLSWLEHLPPKQNATGSNPVRNAKNKNINS